MKTRPSAPEANEGFIPTLNQMGFMTSTLDPFSSEFVKFCAESSSPKPAFEIGSAYGIAALRVLQAKKPMIVNDLDPRHLEILEAQARQMGLPLPETLVGAFPDQVNFEPSSLSAILACRVLHFLDVPALETGMEKIWHWLEPGGKVFLVCETPYLRSFKDFIPVYEERKKRGDAWPGRIENAFEFTDHSAREIPEFLHWMDEAVLTRLLKTAGFTLERAEIFARPDYPSWVRWDGRESVGAIGRKETRNEGERLLNK